MEYEWERNLISYVSLGRNIRDIRRKRRIRQSEMASRLEISLTHYSNCERGIRKISLEMLLRVCVALDVPLEMLLTGAVDSVAIRAAKRKRPRTRKRNGFGTYGSRRRAAPRTCEGV